ncbi:MAG: hypothetical protein BAJALOKI2v1_160060 [Promethearchaeota archaeon]|nr:MAG: hypothetical protein BAJALOKI2v1_160060 [Candidatus Lokiarchaeota archaeon]
MSQIRIGTSGWVYEHWKNTFYPNDLPQEEILNYYSKHFNTVEVNNTFYNLPNKDTVKKWRSKAPKDFLYSIKANRYITHMKNLKDPQKPIKKMISNIQYLKNNLGPILFQLSPKWHINYKRLKNFLEVLPNDYKYVFELRNKSWFIEKIFTLLRNHEVALCIHDFKGEETPIKITTDFTYLRFHGPDGQYFGSYSQKALKSWSKRIKKWIKQNLDVYIYFNNDAEANAIKNAKELKLLLEGQE